MGAVVALQFATNCALGHYPINPRVVVGINGWLSITGYIIYLLLLIHLSLLSFKKYLNLLITQTSPGA